MWKGLNLVRTVQAAHGVSGLLVFVSETGVKVFYDDQYSISCILNIMLGLKKPNRVLSLPMWYIP